MAEEFTEAQEPPEQHPLELQLKELRTSNQELFAAIRAMGQGLDPSSVLLLRLDTLLGLLLNSQDRLLYEVQFESNMANVLESALRQVRQSKLTEGIAVDGQPVNSRAGLLDPRGNPLG